MKGSVRLKEEIQRYYSQFRRLDQPVAWCSSVGPVEVLLAMGFLVYFPENHAALLGAQRQANQTIPKALQLGYDALTCSYLTSDIGAYLADETPLTDSFGLPSLPKPTILVYNTNQCREVQDWFRFYANEWNCPLLGIHTPNFIQSLSTAFIHEIQAQYERLIDTITRHTGQTFDGSHFKQCLDYTKLASRLWKKILDLNQTPFPVLTFSDSCVYLAPMLLGRGHPWAIEIYDGIYQELLEQQKSALLSPPPVRIYWDGMPIWGRLRKLTTWLEEIGAWIVGSTYASTWSFEYLPDHSWGMEELVLLSTDLFINWEQSRKKNYLIDASKRYQVNAFVYHECQTCARNTNTRYALPQDVQKATGIPYQIISGDMNDMQAVDDQRIRTQLEALVDQAGLL